MVRRTSAAVDLIVGVVIGLMVAVGGGLALDPVRGVPRRVQGRLERALRQIPGNPERERWREELSTVLLESEGRPFKQFREGRELIRAAESLAAIHAAGRARTIDEIGRTFTVTRERGREIGCQGAEVAPRIGGVQPSVLRIAEAPTITSC